MNFANKHTRVIFTVSLAALALFFLWAEAVLAQEAVAPTEAEDAAAIAPAGVTPQSPLYAVDRFFERTGLFFAFGRAARAERRLAIAEERLSEARILADDGDDRAEALTEEYEATFEQATIEAELSGSEDAMSRIAAQATRHSAVLDRVAERVPEQARDRVIAARDRFVENHIAVMRAVAEKNPERAATLFANAAERRALAAEHRAEKVEEAEEKLSEKADEVKARLEEYEKYAAFGEEVSLIARKLRTDEATVDDVDDVVKKATARHIEVLERVRENAPEAAQQGLENALQNAERVRAMRTDALSPAQVEERILLHREDADKKREEMKEIFETRATKSLLPRVREQTETKVLDEAGNRIESKTKSRTDGAVNRVETRTRIENTDTRIENKIESRIAPAPTGVRAIPATAPRTLEQAPSTEVAQ